MLALRIPAQRMWVPCIGRSTQRLSSRIPVNRGRLLTKALAELVHSINEFGMMQPIVVREIGDGAGERRYQLVMGSAGGGLQRAGWLRSRLSSAKPKMIICSGMHYWRTSTERS